MPLRLLALAMLLLAAGPPGAAAEENGGTGVGHSGWTWSSPVPQGNTIRALTFAGSIGYAGGEFGTLLRSSDGGLSWTGLATGVTDEISDLGAVDSDSLVLAADCAVRRSDDAGATFRRLPWTARDSRCRVPVVSVAFPAHEVVYLLLEDGKVMRSGDGGASWNRMADVPGTAQDGGPAAATSLTFREPDAGIATTAGGIYTTSNGGVSWSRVHSRRGGFEDAVFADEGSAYAVGAGAIAKSVDGGRTWLPLPFAGSLELSSVRCESALACLAATKGGERVLRTWDGGLFWSVGSLRPGAAYAIAFSAPLRAVAAGGSGAVSISSNGGGTWSEMGRSLGGGFTGLAARSQSSRFAASPGSRQGEAFAIGQRGRIAATDDGGATWSYLAPPSDQDVIDVSFASQLTGFALDVSGSLHRTDDAGRTWRPLAANSLARPQAVLALDPDHVLLVGARGVRRSLDGGLTFDPASRKAVRRATLFGIDEAGDALVAYGPTTLLMSRDGGATWRKVRRPDHRPLATAEFLSPRLGYGLGKGGRTWRTRNSGRTWREVLAIGTDGAADLAFTNARDGYVVARDLFFARGSGRPDYVLRTTDGGTSWRPQLVTGRGRVTALLAASGTADLLLASDSELFVTVSGGDAGRRSSLSLRARHRRLPKAGSVTVKGRLVRARGGEQVVVSKTNVDPRSRRAANDWDFKSVRVRTDGSFRVKWTIRRTTAFVAQWTGDGERRGAGSEVVTVRVKKRKR